MSLLEEPGFAISISIIILGLALGLPSLSLGDFGLDFSQMNTLVISVLRLGLISLAVVIGTRPLRDEKDQKV